jgi:hypothetical protein
MLNADMGAAVDDFMIVEGGPLDGLQCGEKMWIIFDAKSPPYYDVQFLVIGKLIAYNFSKNFSARSLTNP